LTDVLDRRVVVEFQRSPLVVFEITRLALVPLIALLDLALAVSNPLLEQSDLLLEMFDLFGVGHGETSYGIVDRRFASASASEHCDLSGLSPPASSREIRFDRVASAPRLVIRVICGGMAQPDPSAGFARRRYRQLVACELQGIGDWKNGASIEASADQRPFFQRAPANRPDLVANDLGECASIGVARVRLARRPGVQNALGQDVLREREDTY